MDWQWWQERWDAQQATYMPDREERFAAMIDTVEAVAPDAPVVLDLAGGTGSVSRRLLDRLPAARTVVLDVDASLLEIARASFADDERVRIVHADLGNPSWRDTVIGTSFDAVLTATALHWLSDERRAVLYAEVREVLRPGGVFLNADHMDDPGLPGLSASVADLHRRRREARWAAEEELSWDGWWQAARADAWLAPFVRERDAFYGANHAAESAPPESWHLEALRRAGFTQVGSVWRGLRDAAVAGVR